jgi:mannose-6-phosphate isomerase-like protein (cupin superfamily)
MHVRRVVTGQTGAGKSVFVGDDQIPPITVRLLPGVEFHAVWGNDAPPSLPANGSRPEARTWFPAAGGFRFAFFTLPPEGATSATAPALEADLAEVAEKLPGLLEAVERDNPGMHTTDTIDFDYIVSGEVWLELDDGAQTHLEAGDCVIQNGTRHAWRNRGSEPCVIAVALIGAQRSPIADRQAIESAAAAAQ